MGEVCFLFFSLMNRGVPIYFCLVIGGIWEKRKIEHSTPKSIMGVLAQAKRGVTNSFGNRNFMQPMGRLSMHSQSALIFFLSGFGGEGGFFSFSIWSQHVPLKFPMGSQYVPQGCS
jgi:hypothetical protein